MPPVNYLQTYPVYISDYAIHGVRWRHWFGRKTRRHVVGLLNEEKKVKQIIEIWQFLYQGT